MNFKLKAYPIFEIGARANQEDSLYPKFGESSDESRLFIVCDGMGGHDGGEIASVAVCDAMSIYIEENYSGHGEFLEAVFEGALSSAYDRLDSCDSNAIKKMGTTMTFLQFHSGGVFVAHIGDSRIFHIRPSHKEILFETRDHSLVNRLVDAGEMTQSEAAVSPQRNVITRAMQPHQPRRSRADIQKITDVRAGDYFLMCTDGMIENGENDYFANILSDSNDDDLRKIDILKKLTHNNKDNHTAYLIHILDV